MYKYNYNDFSTASGRARITSAISALEHKKAEVESELKELKGLCLSYMDEEGIVELSAGGRTWKAITREQSRLNSDLVKDFCKEVGKDVAELKTLSTQRFFQLCK